MDDNDFYPAKFVNDKDVAGEMYDPSAHVPSTMVHCFDPTLGSDMPPPLPPNNGCTPSKIKILKSSVFLPYYKAFEDPALAKKCTKDTRRSFELQGWMSTVKAYGAVEKTRKMRNLEGIRTHHGNHLFLRYPTHWSDLDGGLLNSAQGMIGNSEKKGRRRLGSGSEEGSFEKKKGDEGISGLENGITSEKEGLISGDSEDSNHRRLAPENPPRRVPLRVVPKKQPPKKENIVFPELPPPGSGGATIQAEKKWWYGKPEEKPEDRSQQDAVLHTEQIFSDTKHGEKTPPGSFKWECAAVRARGGHNGVSDFSCNHVGAVVEFWVWGDWLQSKKLMASWLQKDPNDKSSSPEKPATASQGGETPGSTTILQTPEQQLNIFSDKYKLNLRPFNHVSADTSEEQETLYPPAFAGNKDPDRPGKDKLDFTPKPLKNLGKNSGLNLGNNTMYEATFPSTEVSPKSQLAAFRWKSKSYIYPEPSKYGVSVTVELTNPEKLPLELNTQFLGVRFCNFPKMRSQQKGGGSVKPQNSTSSAGSAGSSSASSTSPYANQPFSYIDRLQLPQTKYTSVYIDANGEENVCVDNVDSISFPYDETRNVLGKVVMVCKQQGAKLPSVLASTQFSNYLA